MSAHFIRLSILNSLIVDKSGENHSYKFISTRVSTERIRVRARVASAIVPIPDYPITRRLFAFRDTRDKSDLIDTCLRVYGRNPRITKPVRNILTGGGLAS